MPMEYYEVVVVRRRKSEKSNASPLLSLSLALELEAPDEDPANSSQPMAAERLRKQAISMKVQFTSHLRLI